VEEAFYKEGTKKLVEVNARVQTDEEIVIVTDDLMVHHARRVAQAASVVGAEVVICIMPPRTHHGQEPPPPVAAAMKKAHVIFSPVSYSITHTVAMRSALEAGTRAILMTAWTEDIYTSPGLLKTDFKTQADICRRLGDRLTEGEMIRLMSPRGTDLSFSIQNRTSNILTNIPEPGELAPVPDIEVNIVPVEGTANGKLVADASVPYLGIGILQEPIICTIEKGFITQMEGGNQAKILEENLISHNDPNCFNVAELGIGLNPNACLTGVMLEDEGVLGTIHMGIGTNYTLGGKIVAPVHYDLLMWSPTIEVDGNLVQKNRDIFV